MLPLPELDPPAICADPPWDECRGSACCPHARPSTTDVAVAPSRGIIAFMNFSSFLALARAALFVTFL